MMLNRDWGFTARMAEAEEGNDLPGSEPEALEPEEADLPDELDNDDADAEMFESLASEFDTDDALDDDEPGEEESPEDSEEEGETEAPSEEAQEKPAESEEETPVPEEESQPLEEEPESKEEPEAEALKQTYEQTRSKHLESLEKLYKFESEEDIKALKEAPETVLPKLAAQLTYDVHEMVVRSMMSMTPRMIENFVNSKVRDHQENESFYQQWEPLRDPKYAADIRRAKQLYRHMNPDASVEQINREVGAALMVSHKIPFDPATGKVISQPEQEARPTAHRPVRPGGVVSGPASKSEWEELIEEDD